MSSDSVQLESPIEPPRSWWQFSLRTMFVVVTLLVVALAWFVNTSRRT